MVCFGGVLRIPTCCCVVLHGHMVLRGDARMVDDGRGDMKGDGDGVVPVVLHARCQFLLCLFTWWGLCSYAIYYPWAVFLLY